MKTINEKMPNIESDKMPISTCVVIPINTLKDDEVYAPGYSDGSKLGIVHFPIVDGSEIRIATVNNKNEKGEKIIGIDTTDAIGISDTMAIRVGVDFVGDMVMIIPGELLCTKED